MKHCVLFFLTLATILLVSCEKAKNDSDDYHVMLLPGQKAIDILAKAGKDTTDIKIYGYSENYISEDGKNKPNTIVFVGIKEQKLWFSIFDSVDRMPEKNTFNWTGGEDIEDTKTIYSGFGESKTLFLNTIIFKGEMFESDNESKIASINLVYIDSGTYSAVTSICACISPNMYKIREGVPITDIILKREQKIFFIIYKKDIYSPKSEPDCGFITQCIDFSNNVLYTTPNKYAADINGYFVNKEESIILNTIFSLERFNHKNNVSIWKSDLNFDITEKYRIDTTTRETISESIYKYTIKITKYSGAKSALTLNVNIDTGVVSDQKEVAI